MRCKRKSDGGFWESSLLKNKKQKQKNIRKVGLFFPLDIVMPGCDIYKYNSHLATKSELSLMTDKEGRQKLKTP